MAGEREPAAVASSAKPWRGAAPCTLPKGGVPPTRGGFDKFDVTDTLILKGIAIASITLHNYYHLLGPIKENEFDFDPARFRVFLHSLQDPRLELRALFAFLGHYGVQIFIFLSAYGLAIRHWDTVESSGSFLWSRVKKIYPTFFLALLAWALYRVFMTTGGITRESLWRVGLTVLGVENIVPGLGLPPVGPWWFLPFIMQFYVLWPSLKRVAARFGAQGLIVLTCSSVALIYMVNDALVARWSINLMETPIGHMPEFCLGIFAARSGWLPGSKAGLVGAALLIAGNAYRALWPLSFAGALLLALWLYQGLAPVLRGWSPIKQLGMCSMALFFVNGFVRFPFLDIALKHVWTYQFTLGFCSMGFAIVVAQMLIASQEMLQSAFRSSDSLESIS